MGQQTNQTAGISNPLKGFDNYIELIPTGTHVDSKGQTCTFTDADFNELIANTDTSTDSVPIVIGHPKDISPAYGWGKDFKVEDGRLYGLFRDVNVDFAEAVKNKSYPNRSISLGRNDKGLYIRHVGFLGGVAPAIKGMAEVQFSEDASEQVFEFAASTLFAQRSAFANVAYQLQSVGNLFRSIRDKMIETDGLEAANQLFSEWQINGLQTCYDNIMRDLDALSNGSSGIDGINNYSETDFESAFVNGMVAAGQDWLKTEQATKDAQVATQAAAEAARAEAASEFAERNAQLATENAQLKAQVERQRIDVQVSGWQQAGKLTPANASGIAEFMVGLSGAEQTIEFSEGGNTQSARASTWFANFVDRLNPIQLGAELAGGAHAPLDNDAATIAAAAHEYTRSQGDKGIVVQWTDAVMHVSRAASASQ